LFPDSKPGFNSNWVTETTETVAVLLSADPQAFVTLTQYDVVAESAGVVYVEKVAPPIAAPPGAVPWYHWYARGAVPEADTLSVAVLPLVIVWLCGCAVIVGAAQTVALFAVLGHFPLGPLP